MDRRKPCNADEAHCRRRHLWKLIMMGQSGARYARWRGRDPRRHSLLCRKMPAVERLRVLPPCSITSLTGLQEGPRPRPSGATESSKSRRGPTSSREEWHQRQHTAAKQLSPCQWLTASVRALFMLGSRFSTVSEGCAASSSSTPMALPLESVSESFGRGSTFFL